MGSGRECELCLNCVWVKKVCECECECRHVSVLVLATNHGIDAMLSKGIRVPAQLEPMQPLSNLAHFSSQGLFVCLFVCVLLLLVLLSLGR